MGSITGVSDIFSWSKQDATETWCCCPSLCGKRSEYLTQQIKEIDGILPAKMYDGTTGNAYHLYMFRYDAERFDGLSRDKFIKALDAEGVPSSSGYGPLNKEPFIKDLHGLRSFKRFVQQQRSEQLP
jgi:perosamine synthetase